MVAAENKAIELHFLKLDIVPITENCVSNGLNVSTNLFHCIK